MFPLSRQEPSSLYVAKQAPSAFLIVQLQALGARVISQFSWQEAPLAIRLMLVAPEQAPSAFLIVQLQRLAPRGHKSDYCVAEKRHYVICLMLVGADQGASAFLFTLFHGKYG